MRKWLVVFFAGFAALAPAICAQPAVSAVLNAASYDAAVSPGCWVSVMGSGLAGATVTADATPLPTSLGGTTVTVGGVAAQFLYVSPAQINLVIPIDIVIPDNTVVPLVVTSEDTADRLEFGRFSLT